VISPSSLRRAGVAFALLAASFSGIATAVTSSLPAAAGPGRACGQGFPAYERPAVATGSTTLTDQAVEMSDGVWIRLDITLPTGAPTTRFPTALTITGYGKSSPLIGALGGGPSADLVAHGYAVVTMDDRGTGNSGGQWDSWGPRTQQDYAEVLEWITHQPWSDGRIGLTGGSYMGITSLYAAAQGNPAVKAVFATVPMADSYRDIVFGGGQPNLAFIPMWMGLVTGLGYVSATSPGVALDHTLGLAEFQVPTLGSAVLGGDAAYDGPFWRQRSPIEVVDRITAPTFIVGGLDDIFQRGEPLLYERLAKHTDARLLIGPWTHVTAGTGLPRDGVASPAQLLLQWFDHYVLGLDAGTECIPPVTQFVRGHEQYESVASWPAPGLRAERWFLRGAGGLATGAPAAAESPQQFVSTLPTGICSRSTAQWLLFVFEGTPCQSDNRLGEVGGVTYTSAPFDEPTEINGPIEADLWVTTDRTEASVSVAVSDVAPDGTSRGLTNGLLLASHRATDPARARLLDGQSIQPWHPFTRDAVLKVTPGEPMLLPIEVFPTSAVLRPGHRLRITVAPYDVPHALPPVDPGLETLGATVRILTDPQHPSSVVFPIAEPRTNAQAGGAATEASIRSSAAGPDAPAIETTAASAIDPARPLSSRRPSRTPWGIVAAVLAAAAAVTTVRTHRRRRQIPTQR
jgi:predicted acyl esterase